MINVSSYKRSDGVKVASHKRRNPYVDDFKKTDTSKIDLDRKRKTLDFPNKEDVSSSLKTIFKIYIPSTKDKSVKITNLEFRKRIKDVIDFILNNFEGATLDTAFGNYKMKDKLISEQVAILEVYTTQKDYNRFDLEIKDYLLKKKDEWGQDSIGYEYNNKLLFI